MRDDCDDRDRARAVERGEIGDGERLDDDLVGYRGLPIAMLGAMLRRPQDTLAGALAATALAAILVNALFLQPNPHPAPMFAPPPKRSAATLRDSTGAVALPRPRPPELAARAEPAAPPRAENGAKPPPGRSRAEIVSDIQRELARRGYYGGPANGVLGVRTVAAIRAFERAAGLPPSGEASEATLKAVLRAPAGGKPASARAPARPDPIGDLMARSHPDIPQRPSPSAAAPAPQMEPAPSAPPARSEPAPVPRVEASAVAPPPADPPLRSDSIATAPPKPESTATAPAPSKRVRAVQQALTDFGYGQVKPSGVADAATRVAIEEFERSNRMPVTGEVTDALVRELGGMVERPIE